MLELPLPEVDAEHVTVQCDNEICHGNPESRTQQEELWRSLEGPLLSGEALGKFTFRCPAYMGRKCLACCICLITLQGLPLFALALLTCLCISLSRMRTSVTVEVLPACVHALLL